MFCGKMSWPGSDQATNIPQKQHVPDSDGADSGALRAEIRRLIDRLPHELSQIHRIIIVVMLPASDSPQPDTEKSNR
jgi:hypothetical protein